MLATGCQNLGRLNRKLSEVLIGGALRVISLLKSTSLSKNQPVVLYSLLKREFNKSFILQSQLLRSVSSNTMVCNKILTLVLIRESARVLLGMKKRGFGQGRWNGFGGKVEKGETILQGAIRLIMFNDLVILEGIGYQGYCTPGCACIAFGVAQTCIF